MIPDRFNALWCELDEGNGVNDAAGRLTLNKSIALQTQEQPEAKTMRLARGRKPQRRAQQGYKNQMRKIEFGERASHHLRSQCAESML